MFNCIETRSYDVAKNVHHVVFNVGDYTQKSKVYGFSAKRYPSGTKYMFKVFNAETRKMIYVGDCQSQVIEICD